MAGYAAPGISGLPLRQMYRRSPFGARALDDPAVLVRHNMLIPFLLFAFS